MSGPSRPDPVVRRESPSDAAAVRAVVAEAFADETVADLWEALRERPGSVGVVAVEGGDVVGHVGLSWSWLDAPGRLVEVLVLSPLSVAVAHQGRGVGSALVRAAVTTADELGSPLLFLEGDPAYYTRLGFERADAHGFVRPSVRIPWAAFQVVRLASYDVSMSGALVYADTFWALDCVGLRGELLDRLGD